MITVYLNKADFEYDIHSLVKAFYAGEDVKVFADREKIQKLQKEQFLLFHMEIFYRRDRIEIFLYIPLRRDGVGQAVKDAEEMRREAEKESEHYMLQRQAVVKTDFSERKETKNQLKQCLYQLLSEYTGTSLPWGTLTGIRPVKIPTLMLEQGKEEAEIKTYMTETYLASEQKIDLSIEIAKREMELLRQIDYQNGYSLYVGIPFCPSICSYCSFSSSPIGAWEERVDDYLTALEREIDFTADACRDRKLNAVYIGGGTPTTLSSSQLDRLLSKIKRSFNFSNLLEYTVEAGRPDSITREKLEVLRSYGISRISINPQTMKQETLDLIGRRHSVEQTLESFSLAREMGFDNINMDLIVGLPEETPEDVKNTLEQVKMLAPDNLTVHSLAIKRAARLKMFPEDYKGMKMSNTWEIIDLTADYARKMGLVPYYLYRQKNMAGNFENVGYAKPGKAGLYNILIMEEVQNIAACGAGSISKRVYPDGRIERCENVKDVAQYIERIDEMVERKRALLFWGV
ncbi:MAG: coproporphyrinogen dehydrogenase HemZ [Lachnospiraceae bacterium]|nr:coproporphyrinogen dehydrogenase HemZ [Lachnospiraceae bacterium]